MIMALTVKGRINLVYVYSRILGLNFIVWFWVTFYGLQGDSVCILIYT